MSDVDDLVTYVFRWRTSRDGKVCAKCELLDGQVIFYNLFAPILVSDTHGPVWDLDRDHSLAHGYHRYNCRCMLDVEAEFDWNKIAEFQELRNTLKRQRIDFKFVVERFKLSSNISFARDQMTSFLNIIRRVKSETRETNDALSIYLALARRSGDENINRLISLFQRGRITAEMFIRALITLYAASGPLGWMLGAGQFALGSLMVAQEVHAIAVGSQSAREDAGSEGPR